MQASTALRPAAASVASLPARSSRALDSPGGRVPRHAPGSRGCRQSWRRRGRVHAAASAQQLTPLLPSDVVIERSLGSTGVMELAAPAPPPGSAAAAGPAAAAPKAAADADDGEGGPEAAGTTVVRLFVVRRMQQGGGDGCCLTLSGGPIRGPGSGTSLPRPFFTQGRVVKPQSELYNARVFLRAYAAGSRQAEVPPASLCPYFDLHYNAIQVLGGGRLTVLI